MLSHVDRNNRPRMVDVGEKEVTLRTARARAVVRLPPAVAKLFRKGELTGKKGPVFQTAILAGIQGAKRTGELIPLCHPIGMDDCTIEIRLEKNLAIIDCSTRVHARTGIEMEALTGASVAALTIYDMLKAVSHDIVIEEIKLMAKRGGKRDFTR